MATLLFIETSLAGQNLMPCRAVQNMFWQTINNSEQTLYVCTFTFSFRTIILPTTSIGMCLSYPNFLGNYSVSYDHIKSLYFPQTLIKSGMIKTAVSGQAKLNDYNFLTNQFLRLYLFPIQDNSSIFIKATGLSLKLQMKMQNLSLGLNSDPFMVSSRVASFQCYSNKD